MATGSKVRKMDDESDFSGSCVSVTEDESSVETGGEIRSFRHLQHHRRGQGLDKANMGYQKRLAHIIMTTESANEDPRGKIAYAMDDFGEVLVETGINWEEHKSCAARKLSLVSIKNVFKDDEEIQELWKTNKYFRSNLENVDKAFAKFEAFIKDMLFEECSKDVTAQFLENLQLKDIKRYLNLFKQTFTSRSSDSNHFDDSD